MGQNHQIREEAARSWWRQQRIKGFKADPRQWLKSHFEHSPKVFGALWAECRREYFDDLRRCFRFLGLDYLPDREEVYPPIFPDEVLSEAEQEQVEVYIKHHVKRGN